MRVESGVVRDPKMRLSPTYRARAPLGSPNTGIAPTYIPSADAPRLDASGGAPVYMRTSADPKFSIARLSDTRQPEASLPVACLRYCRIERATAACGVPV